MISKIKENLHPLLDLIIDHVPPQKLIQKHPFSFLATLLSYDTYVGRCLIGKVESGNKS